MGFIFIIKKIEFTVTILGALTYICIYTQITTIYYLMSYRNITKLLSIGLLFFMNFSAIAQEANVATFTLDKNGEQVIVTQDIETNFLGMYTKTGGNKKWSFGLDRNGNSFYFAQTLSDPFNKKYDWDETQRKPMHWGVLVENGEVVKKKVQEYKNGELYVFEAMILYYTVATGETYDVLLYENDGEYFLESAMKESNVASME
jgi:hypothetical protein